MACGSEFSMLWETVPLVARIVFICLASLGDSGVGCDPQVTPSPTAVAIESQPLTLTCLDDKAVSRLFWSRKNETFNTIRQDCSIVGSSTIDTSLYNYSCISDREYTWTILSVTEQEHGVNWTCTVADSQGSFVNGQPTVIYVAVPATSVSITSPTSNPVHVAEHQSTQFICTTSPERPRSTIKWYFRNRTNPLPGGTVLPSENDTLVSTVGTLTYSFNRSEDRNELYCTAVNIDGRTPVESSTSSKQISVRYAPDAGPIIVNYTSGNTYNMIASVQQTLTCYVTGGNPTPTLTWNCYFGTETDISGQGEVRKTVSWTTSNHSQGTCTCTSDQDISGRQSVSLNIQVLYSPSNPVFSANRTVFTITLREIKGRSVEVNCSSSSRPSPSSYQWTKTDTGSVTNSTILRLKNVQSTSEGTYRCTVSNIMEPTVGDTTTGTSNAEFSLEVLSSPADPVLTYKSVVITTQLSVVQGDNVSVSCTSSSIPGPPTYSWTGPQSSGNSQLVMSDIQSSKTGTYTCKVTNNMNPTAGPLVVGRNQAVTSITVMKGPSVPKLLYIPQTGTSRTLSATTLAVIRGTSFSIRCNGSSSVPTPSYNWTGPVTIAADTVGFNNINSDKHGTYVCHVTNVMDRTVGDTEIGRNTKQITVDVLFAPEIRPIADKSLTEYESLNVQCDATSNPSPTNYSWTRSKDNFRQSFRYLSMTNATRDDTDVYTCTVRNQMTPTLEGNSVPGENTITVSIRVLYHPDITISQPNGTDIKEGDKNVMLLCDAEGDPNNFTFTNWTQYAPGGSTVVREYRADEYSYRNVALTFPTVSYMDSGIFEIQASNGVPEHQTRTLYAKSRVPQLVKGRPVITEYKSDVTAATHSNATLSVVYYSNDGSEPIVQWYKVENDTKERILDNDSRIYFETGFKVTNVVFHSVEVAQPGNITKLFITNVQASDFGNYEVEIVNTIGQADVKSTRFISESVPDPPREFRALQDSTTKSTVVVTWMSGFHGGANQTFYIDYNTTNLPWQSGAVIEGGQRKNAVFNATLDGLVSETHYFFKIHAKNKFGDSEYVISEGGVTTKSDQQQLTGSDPPIGAAVGGGVGGAVVIIGIVVLIVFIKRRTPAGNQKKTLLDGNKRNGGTGDNDDLSEVKNPMYESADTLPSTSKGNDVYAVVDKSKKQQNAATTNNPADLYSQVQKPKKGKPDKTDGPSKDIYSTPVKPKDKTDGPSKDIYSTPVKPKGKQAKEKKQKHGKKTKGGKNNDGIQGQVNEGMVYDNAEQLRSNGTVDENAYELTQCYSDSSKASKIQNEDGLTYVTVDFPQTSKGKDKMPFVIHGIDDTNEYADIAFGKVGEPAPESDDEDKTKEENAKQD